MELRKSRLMTSPDSEIGGKQFCETMGSGIQGSSPGMLMGLMRALMRAMIVSYWGSVYPSIVLTDPLTLP